MAWASKRITIWSKEMHLPCICPYAKRSCRCFRCAQRKPKVGLMSKLCQLVFVGLRAMGRWIWECTNKEMLSCSKHWEGDTSKPKLINVAWWKKRELGFWIRFYFGLCHWFSGGGWSSDFAFLCLFPSLYRVYNDPGLTCNLLLCSTGARCCITLLYSRKMGKNYLRMGFCLEVVISWFQWFEKTSSQNLPIPLTWAGVWYSGPQKNQVLIISGSYRPVSLTLILV